MVVEMFPEAAKNAAVSVAEALRWTAGHGGRQARQRRRRLERTRLARRQQQPRTTLAHRCSNACFSFLGSRYNSSRPQSTRRRSSSTAARLLLLGHDQLGPEQLKLLAKQHGGEPRLHRQPCRRPPLPATTVRLLRCNPLCSSLRRGDSRWRPQSPHSWPCREGPGAAAIVEQAARAPGAAAVATRAPSATAVAEQTDHTHSKRNRRAGRMHCGEEMKEGEKERDKEEERN
ncbi:hypothetical protein OsI_35703 [Oryza sativa Indica Group]|uniref:Uncharacterized protein n=1 Tax=Oryza sativa subsp. indica TaxID=39946 RepID=A2ZD40_ORYSI|nr:hypothetical protein OsI_35703 [Oryza sativa Indica Group]